MNSSKTKHGDDSPYNKKYSMHQHRGNIEDHKRWKREGSCYFKASTFVILGLILSNALDVNPIIKTWPIKPEGWKPTTIGDETAESEAEEEAIALTTPEESEDNEEAELSEETTEDIDTTAKQNYFKVDDILYLDTKRVKPIKVTVNDLIQANDVLNLFMSATAPLLMPESIAIGTPSDEITAYFVLGRLDDKLGNINSITETYSLIGQSLTLRFKCGDESASEYLRRMKTKLAPLKSKPKLKKHVDAIIPWVFLNNINKSKFKPYDHMAETILLDKDIETKVQAGYNVFEKYLESLEATLKCQQKARWAQSIKRNPRANGATRKDHRNSNANNTQKGTRKLKPEATANGARGTTKMHECKNCRNEATLLKIHDQKRHTTRDCPFPPTKETIRFFQQKATVIPTGKFADMFASAAGARQKTTIDLSSGEGTGSDEEQ